MRLAAQGLLIVGLATAFALPGSAAGDDRTDVPMTHAAFVDAPVYIKSFGSLGSEEGQLLDPWHVVLDEFDRLIVADSGNDRIQLFTRYGKFIDSFGVGGSGPGELNSPRGVALTAESDIIVADTLNHRIQLFTPDGQLVGGFGSPGGGDGELDSPHGLVINALSQIVVADTGNHRVQILETDGRYVDTIGEFGDGDGQLDRPVDVAIDRDGRMYVAEEANSRVSVFDEQGLFLMHIGGPGEGSDEMTSPTAIFIDDHDVLHVADFGNGRIQGYEGTDYHELGHHLWTFQHGEGDAPRGIVVDARGRTFISDAPSGTVEIWRYLKCAGRRGSLVGTDGDDRLFGGESPEVIVGRGGDDFLGGSFAGDFVCGGPGNDLIGGWFGRDRIWGGAGNDKLAGGRGNDVIRGNRGNDQINGRDGADLILGNRGRDMLVGWRGKDGLRGGPGEDDLRGGIRNDVLIGGPADDVCRGGRGLGDEFGLCESIVDLPEAPDDWYPVNKLAANKFGNGLAAKDDLALDPGTGLLWGVDGEFERLLVRDHGGALVAEIDLNPIEGLEWPTAIAVRDDDIYVVGATGVFVVDRDGNLLRHWLRAEGDPGRSKGFCDVAIGDDVLYVLELNPERRIQAFTLQGELVFEIHDLGLHPKSFDCSIDHRDGVTYLLDWKERQISVIDDAGNELRRIAVAPLRDVTSIAVDSANTVWIGDQGRGVVAVDSTGEQVARLRNLGGVTAIVPDPGGDVAWVIEGRRCCHGEVVHRIRTFTRLSCDGLRLTNVGSSYRDRFTTGSVRNVVHGGPGNDRIRTGLRDDIVCGGSGNDVLRGGQGDDLLLGQTGDDKLVGSYGRDECDGGVGRNELVACE